MSAVKLNVGKLLGLAESAVEGTEEAKLLAAVASWRKRFETGTASERLRLADLICDGMRLAADLRAMRLAAIARTRF